MLLTRSRNGSAPAVELHLQHSVKSVFSNFNWSNTSGLRSRPGALPPSSPEELPSLRVSVQQFFAAAPWETNRTAAPVPTPVDHKPYTLDDFSDLF